MSSQSPFADPRGRSVSGTPSSGTSNREVSELSGQDQGYAENWHNPLPEIVFTTPTTTTIATPPLAGADGATEGTSPIDTISSHHPDTVGTKESAMHEDVWVEPKETPWYRRISKLAWIIIAMTIVGVLAVLLAILGAMGILTGESNHVRRYIRHGDWHFRQLNINQLPKPQIDCHLPSTFLTSITWIGTSVGAYRGQFAQASSASACCSTCLSGSSAAGCAGWLYNASSVP
ncbi:hypothetical protein N0V88_002660 [Collariella sp. IMI 366227]|nr:hypothetical protein N0V88_002660 [Collariella sp. IMI 366227]